MTDRLSLSTVCLLVMAVVDIAFATSANARGGAGFMQSPGYQRRLIESRQQLSQPAAAPVQVYERKVKRRDRGHR